MATLWEIGLANALVVGVAAPCAWLLLKVAKRPALAHAVWVILLLKLIVPPFAKLPVMIAQKAETPKSIAEIPKRSPSPIITIVPKEPAPILTPVVTSAPVVREPRWTFSWAQWLGWTWVGGSVAWSLLATARIVRFGRIVRQADDAPEELCAWVAELSAQIGLKRSPRVAMAPGKLSPMVWALGSRACLLVPEELWSQLDRDQRAALLIHELAHLKRKDHWVRVLELVATGLFWWHPALWLSRRELHRAEEACCDSWVVWALPGSKRPYAAALVDAVEFLSAAPSRKLPVGASGMGQVEDLSRRIGMIMRGDTPRGLGRAGMLATIGLAMFLVPWRPTLAQDAPKEEPAKPSAPIGEETAKPADPTATKANPNAKDELSDRVKAFIEAYQKEMGTISDPLLEMDSKRALDRLTWSIEMYRKGLLQRGAVNNDMAILERIRAKVASAQRDRDRGVLEARENQQLAMGRLRAQQARSLKAEAQKKLAMSTKARYLRMKAKEPNSVSISEFENAEAELMVAEALLQEAKAEEGLSQIQVQQADRRLQEAEHADPTNAEQNANDPLGEPKPPTRETQKRLDELEMKLDRVLKEIEAMRKDANDSKPRPLGEPVRSEPK